MLLGRASAVLAEARRFCRRVKLVRVKLVSRVENMYIYTTGGKSDPPPRPDRSVRRLRGRSRAPCREVSLPSLPSPPANGTSRVTGPRSPKVCECNRGPRR